MSYVRFSPQSKEEVEPTLAWNFEDDPPEDRWFICMQRVRGDDPDVYVAFQARHKNGHKNKYWYNAVNTQGETLVHKMEIIAWMPLPEIPKELQDNG